MMSDPHAGGKAVPLQITEGACRVRILSPPRVYQTVLIFSLSEYLGRYTMISSCLLPRFIRLKYDIHVYRIDLILVLVCTSRGAMF